MLALVRTPSGASLQGRPLTGTRFIDVKSMSPLKLEPLRVLNHKDTQWRTSFKMSQVMEIPV